MTVSHLFDTTTVGARWPTSGDERASALQANLWHAYSSTADMTGGARLLITGGHRRIRLRTGDRLTVEMPTGQRYSAIVLERTERSLRLSGQDGAVHDLAPASGTNSFVDFKLSDGFSREVWKVE